jgi:hypothetical protein
VDTAGRFICISAELSVRYVVCNRANEDAEMQEEEKVNEPHQNLDEKPLPPAASAAPSPLLPLVLPTTSLDAEVSG